MNIFKAIGMVITSAVSVITKALKAIENVAEMADLTTSNMLEEQKLEAEQALITMRASFASTNRTTAKSTKSTTAKSTTKSKASK